MSCIRFSTDAQRDQFRSAAPVMLSPDEAARRHPAPAVTESKLRRLRLLAVSADPKIRESAASGPHTPADVLDHLAADPDDGVRGCVARNPSAAAALLRGLADDPSEQVRGWVALNPAAPADAIQRLVDDPSTTVSGLVAWRLEAS